MATDDSLLKNLAKLIPGYGSYLEQESRREDDRLTREFLAKRLQDCKAGLDKLGAAAVAAGDLEAPARTEQLNKQLDRAQVRIRAAMEGYSGWFNQRQVDAEVLKKVAELDANLVSLVDQIDSGIQQLVEQSAFQQADKLAEIGEWAELLHARIDRRTEFLRAAT